MPAEPAPPPRPIDAASLASLSSLRLLLALCVALPILLFVTLALHRLQVAQDDARDRTRRTLRVAHEHALKVFDTNEALLRRVLDLVEGEDDASLRRQEAALHRQLVQMAAGKPQIQSIWIWDAQGRPVAGNRLYPAPQALDVSDRAFFRHHQAGRGGLYLTEPLVSRATREPFFDLSLGRYRPDGSFAGLVSMGLFPHYFRDFHADLLDGDAAVALTLFREDGAVYARTPESSPPLQRLPEGSATLAHLRSGEPSGEFTGASSFDGRERFVALRKVGPYPAHVTAALDLQAVRAVWLREVALYAVLCLLPAAGLLGAAVIAQRRTRLALQAAQQLQQQTDARVQAEEALLQAQKLEAIGRLTGGVAHDFNNALMVLSGNLFLVRRVLAAEHHRLLDSMGRAVDSAAKLTRQLLAFSRKQVLAPQPVRLQEVLPSLQELLRPVFGAGVRMAIEVDGDVPPVRIDVAELELAILNLAMNARDAMPQGGRFTLHVRAEPDPASPHGRVVIEARDTGTGIAPEVVERVFEPFFTTKPLGQGTGLGLSQVAGLCQRSGGSATVHSAPGAGTTVRLVLPALAPTEAAAAPAEAANTLPHVEQRVLLVEDNAEVAAALVDTLEQLGCSVELRSNGAAALAWLESHPAPDLLLTDVVMPGGIGGVQLAQAVRQRWPQVHVVLMTGYADQLEALEALALPVLHKPFKPRALAEALDAARQAGRAPDRLARA